MGSGKGRRPELQCLGWLKRILQGRVKGKIWWASGCRVVEGIWYGGWQVERFHMVVGLGLKGTGQWCFFQWLH